MPASRCRQSIKIVAPGTRDPRSDSVAAEINGVAKATASVRIINETIINSALQVARARLGFSKGRDPNRVAHAKADVFEPLTFPQMLERGYIRHLRLGNAEVEKAFAGTATAKASTTRAVADPGRRLRRCLYRRGRCPDRRAQSAGRDATGAS